MRQVKSARDRVREREGGRKREREKGGSVREIQRLCNQPNTPSFELYVLYFFFFFKTKSSSFLRCPEHGSTPWNRRNQTKFSPKSLVFFFYSFDFFFGLFFKPFLFSKEKIKHCFLKTSIYFISFLIILLNSLIFFFFILFLIFYVLKMTVNPRCGMHIAHAFLELYVFSFF